VDKTKQPTIKIIGIVLIEGVFKLNGPVAPGAIDGEYDISYTLGIGYESEEILNTTLEVQCHHKKHRGLVTISAKVAGKFECSNREELERYAPNSGVSLIPFLRTYVATMTGWGPMQPIYIPLMNLTAPAVSAEAKRQSKRLPRIKAAVK